MRFARYLILVAVVLISTMARGQFNPVDPAEPAATYQLKVYADPADAATVSGGGRYTVNKSVTVKATVTSEEWRLVNWTNSAGEEVSTNSSFTYKTTNKNETLTAHYERVAISQLTLQSNPASLFTASTKNYQTGTQVSVSCSTYSNYTFQNWTNSAGEVVSSTNKFTYVSTEQNEVLIANYKFTPGSPGEPSMTRPKHKVYFSSTPCSASFSQNNGFLVTEGSSFSIRTWEPTGYVFDGWYVGDVLLSENMSLTTVMGTADMTLVAKFHFHPGGPSEPGSGSKTRYTLYGLTTDMYIGETTLVPVYLENTSYVKALTFDMDLPAGITLGRGEVRTTSRTAGYVPEVTENGQKLTISLTDGTQIGDNNGPILMVPLTTTQEAKDSTYTFTFSNISTTLVDDTTPTCTSRKGALNLSILEEGDLQAQFSVDRYMNRAQFTNMTNGEARSYLWDFGDGTTSTEENPMHIYALPGTYNVTLTAKAIVKTSVADQNIIVNPASTWTASGDYTLDRNASGVRNFTSVQEMFDLLGQCTPDGAINITVATDGVYEMDATTIEALNLIKAMTTKLISAKQQMNFVALNEEGMPGIIDIKANAASSDLQSITAWAKNVTLANMLLRINGNGINPDALRMPLSQAVCAQTATETVDFSQISTGSQMVSVSWYASVNSGCKLSGYDEIGGGNLLPMSISNSGSKTDSVMYHVDYLLDGVSMYSYIYKVYVRPLMSLQTISLTSPAEGVTVNAGSVKLQWTNLNTLATDGYTVYINTLEELSNTDIIPWGGEGDPDVKAMANALEPTMNVTQRDTVHVTTNSYTFTTKPGATYQWYVKAHGTCDDLLSATASFKVKQRADLTVIAVVAPAESKGHASVTVTASVRNIGKGATSASGWYDAIYWSTKPEDFVNAKLLTTVWHSGVLQTGGTYETSFTVTTPEAFNGQVYYYVRVDNSNHENEEKEDNNFLQSNKLELINTFINEDDYAALKVLYNATNGEVWNTPWKINSNAVTSAAWKGVSFNDEGRVTAINLQGNNLVGTVPAEGFVLPYLTSLNLSENSLRGDIVEFTDELPALASLNLSNNLFEELSDVLPSSITSLDLSYQLKNRSLSNFEAQHWILGADMQNVDLSSIIAYNHTAQDFSAHPRLRVVSGSSVVAYLNWNGSSYTASASGYSVANDADLLIQPTEGPAAYCKLRAVVGWLLGDANVDGKVDVLDAQQELNQILGRMSGNWNQLAANVHTDEIINVQDIVATINLFLQDVDDEDVPVINAPAYRPVGEIQPAADVNLYCSAGRLMMNAAEPVAALDIELEGVKANQISLNLNRSRYQMIAHDTRHGVRVVVISPSGDEIPVGEQAILRLSSSASVVKATAANIDAKRMAVVCGDETTGISGVTVQDAEQGDVYDLSGRKLNAHSSQHNGSGRVYIMNGKKVLK